MSDTGMSRERGARRVGLAGGVGGAIGGPLGRRALLGAGLAAVAAVPVLRSRGSDAASRASVAGAGLTSTVLSCADWGARNPATPVTLLTTRPDKIIIHHTDTPNVTDYSRAHAVSLARAIQTSHMDERDFIDSGQHFTITRGGYVLEGRHRSLESLSQGLGQVVGAHCVGQNNTAIGIENEGRYMSEKPPAALVDQLVKLCVDICLQYRIPPTAIHGHRQYMSTDCPGDALYAMLPQLRAAVAAQVGADPGQEPEWPVLSRGTSGELVRTLQYLLRAAGQSVDADGQFGQATQAAVTAVQRAHQIAADGAVGAATWQVLIVQVAKGDSGEAVRAAQNQLAARGYQVSADGKFGALTETAVRDFQTSQGLTADGIVGPRTWRRLLA